MGYATKGNQKKVWEIKFYRTLVIDGASYVK
jgi:hypothetical protein